MTGSASPLESTGGICDVVDATDPASGGLVDDASADTANVENESSAEDISAPEAHELVLRIVRLTTCERVY